MRFSLLLDWQRLETGSLPFFNERPRELNRSARLSHSISFALMQRREAIKQFSGLYGADTDSRAGKLIKNSARAETCRDATTARGDSSSS